MSERSDGVDRETRGLRESRRSHRGTRARRGTSSNELGCVLVVVVVVVKVKPFVFILAWGIRHRGHQDSKDKRNERGKGEPERWRVGVSERVSGGKVSGEGKEKRTKKIAQVSSLSLARRIAARRIAGSTVTRSSKYNLWASAHISLHLHCTIHLSAVTMAPKYLCPCFMCKSGAYLTKKTLKIHLKRNQKHLAQLKASGAHQDTIKLVTNCDYELAALLSSLGKGSHAGQSGSSYPHGKHLISYNTRDYLLICFDLADAHIASPPFSEGELSINEGPHAEQSGSSYPHGKHLISHNTRDYLLICFDLEDAHIASPPFSEGEPSVNEGPYAEQSGPSYPHGKHLISYVLEIIC